VTLGTLGTSIAFPSISIREGRMKVIATGKWSKADKEWKMVLAMHRPLTRSSVPAPRAPGRPVQPPKRPTN